MPILLIRLAYPHLSHSQETFHSCRLGHIESSQEITICPPGAWCGCNDIPGRCLDKKLAIVCQLYSAEAAKNNQSIS